MTDTDETLVIDIVSDVVCPWCYLGEKRLDAALADEPQPVVLRWRPYQLDPTIPEGGLDRREYMEKKFGKSDRLKAVHDNLVRLGAKSASRSPSTGSSARRTRSTPIASSAGRKRLARNATSSTGCSRPISSKDATSAIARC
jgi:predicted DsbA family dithiol-disulfide isomerase